MQINVKLNLTSSEDSIRMNDVKLSHFTYTFDTTLCTKSIYHINVTAANLAGVATSLMVVKYYSGIINGERKKVFLLVRLCLLHVRHSKTLQ